MMKPDERLIAAARAIYDVLFTAAPVPFDEALRRGSVMSRRAIHAAERARACLAAGVRS
jgi:hypothetical protein